MKFRTATMLAAAFAAGVAGAENLGEIKSGDMTVVFRECQKCPARMRFDNDAKRAYVNVARLAEDGATGPFLEARKNAMAERAFSLMKKAQDSRNPSMKRPLMGWSSWNTFGLKISDELILDIAKAMATNGLKDAGYQYVNIDDGFFNGHDENGVLRINKDRFPGGMKRVVDGIHALGLKAGTYSDAGANTCGSTFNNDVAGIGAGLYGHDAADCGLHFNELGFDFIKVDYCGGRELRLDERQRYTEIANAIRATGRKDVRFNICRWAFPGTWAADIAESWRTTGDIRASWASLKYIVSKNLYLSAYAKPGHYNDMDMLEVGQKKGTTKTEFANDTGFTDDEELAHFGMWCMLSSPLLIGCDVRKIPADTLELITNPFLLAVNQNDLGQQAYVAERCGKRWEDAYLLVKDADEANGKARFVALYNGVDTNREFRLNFAAADLGGKVAVFDLVERADYGDWSGEYVTEVPAHGIRVFRLDAEERLERKVYEAETAYLTAFQDLDSSLKTAKPEWAFNAPGGNVVVENLGGSEQNDLVWKNVFLSKPGKVKFTFYGRSPANWPFYVQIDGGKKTKFETSDTAHEFKPYFLEAELAAGTHEVRISNPDGWAPDFDRMTITR